LHDYLHQEMLRDFGPELPPPEITVDATLALGAVQMQVARQLQKLEPFGPGNPTPRLMLSNIRLQRVDIDKEKHLRLTITDASGQQRLGVMMFGAANGPVHQAMQSISPQQKIALLGSLKVNSWQGRQEAQ